MGNVAIVTDSNSGISQAEGKELGIYVIPMPFLVDGKLYFEDVDMNKEQFYHFLENDADLSTSQPSPGDVMDLWDKLLKEYDEIVEIPMSSGLSMSCETATLFSQEKEYLGKVHVVNNMRISVTQRQSVYDALKLVKEGKSGKEIKDILENDALNSSIYITVQDLKYLKKGGRITPAAATLGALLGIKPVLQIQGKKLDAFKKCRGMRAGKLIMIEAAKNDIQNRCFEKIAESLKNIKGNRNRATLLHYLVNELHLFTDGNGRTGRCIFELLTNPEFSFEKNNNFRHTRKEASRADGDIGTNEFESNMHVKNYQKALAYASFLVYKSLLKNNLFSKGVLGKCIYVASDVELLENEYDGSKVFIPEDIRIKLSEKQLEDIDVALCDNNDTELYSTAGLTMAVMQSLKESTIKEKKFEPVPDYTVCDICVGQDECYLEESKKTFDSWTKEDYLRAVKVADYIKEAKLDAMIDIFEHPENFIVEGIGTIADILSGDIYEGVEYPLEIMAKLQQNCKTNFDGTRMQKSIELLEKTLQQNIEEVSKGNIQSVESLARQVVPEMEDVKDVDKTENRIERDILGKSQTEEKLK